MDAERDKFDWIEDFSIRLTRRGILSLSRDPDLELFTGSKFLASLWLAAVAGLLVNRRFRAGVSLTPVTL